MEAALGGALALAAEAAGAERRGDAAGAREGWRAAGAALGAAAGAGPGGRLAGAAAGLAAGLSAAELGCGRPREALAAARRAIELDPGCTAGHHAAGAALGALGEWSEAREHFARSGVDESAWPRGARQVAPAGAPGAEQAGGGAPPPGSRNRGAYRHEWYQTASAVTLGVLVKGCPEDAVSVAFEEESVRVAIAALGEKPDFALDLRLHGRVVPGECSFAVLSSRVEVRLAKATGATWAALESAEGGRGAPAAGGAGGAGGAAAGLPQPYSTSSKSAKDWNGLEAELGREEDKLEGDAALQKLFQDIYLKGNEETRRAMNKSFQESNGTVLSTNWGEVGAGQVDAKPPDGMEARRFPSA